MTLIDRTLAAVIYRESFASKFDELEMVKQSAGSITVPYTAIYGFLNSRLRRGS